MPTSANIVQYAKMVREKALLRNLMHTATEIVERGYEVDTNVDSFIDEAEKMIFQIAEKKYKPSFYSIKDLVMENMKVIERLSEKKQAVTGRAYGLYRARQDDERPPALRPYHSRGQAEHGEDRLLPEYRPARRPFGRRHPGGDIFPRDVERAARHEALKLGGGGRVSPSSARA